VVNGRSDIVNMLCAWLGKCLVNTIHGASGRALLESACVYSFSKKVNTVLNITIAQNYGVCSLC
jgi:hypothetical protein